MPEKFDPEKFVLTKRDILDYIDLITKRWEKNKLKNAIYLSGLLGIRAMTYASSEGLIKKFWGEILKLMNFLMARNAFLNDDNPSENFRKLIDLSKKKMEEELSEPLPEDES